MKLKEKLRVVKGPVPDPEKKELHEAIAKLFRAIQDRMPQIICDNWSGTNAMARLFEAQQWAHLSVEDGEDERRNGNTGEPGKDG